MSIADKEEEQKEALETLGQLTKEFERKGFDSEQLLKDIAEQIEASEIPYQFPAVQRAWVAGKILTPKPKPEFTREYAYEILNYLRSFKYGQKAWSPTKHHHKVNGVLSHSLSAWKVIDDAAKAGIFTIFDSLSHDSQDEVLSEFVEDNSDYLSYVYYAGSKWGLSGGCPIFDTDWTSLDELVEVFRELCANHTFHDVVETIDCEFYY